MELGYDTELNLEYLTYNERQTKTRTGADITNVRPERPRMYATGTERCPVETYKVYDSKRPEGFSRPNDPFYLAVNTTKPNPTAGETWFLRGPVGIHKLNNLMKRMGAKAGLKEIESGKKITNTSVRKSLCQKLLAANVPDTQAIHITGHKNPDSLNNYRQLNNRQQAAYSHLLSNVDPPTVPTSSTCRYLHSKNSKKSSTMQLSQCTQNTVQSNATKNTAQPVFFPNAIIHGGTFNITIKAGSKRKFTSSQSSESEADSQ